MQIRDRIKAFRRVEARQLRNNPNNWRKHGDAQRSALRGLLERLGYVGALIAREKRGKLELLDGHLRAELTPETKVPVLIVDLTDKEAAEVLATYDPVGSLADADSAALGKLLELIEIEDHTLLATLQGLQGDEPSSEPTLDVDTIPTKPPKRAKAGDLWLLGGHRLLCGDCRNKDDVARLLRGVTANIALTSPPYASQRDYDPTSGFVPIPPDEYVDWWEPVQESVAAHLAEDGSLFINIKEACEEGERQLYVKDLTLAHVRRWHWLFVDEFAWVHGGTPRAVRGRFKNAWEPVFQFTRQRRHKMRPEAVMHYSEEAIVPWETGFHPSREDQQGEGMGNRQGIGDAIGASADGRAKPGLAYPGNVLSVGKNREALGHSAAFPVGLPSFFISAYTDLGDSVYEMFAGSGSTLIAAERLGRRCFAMEISPSYCDIIIERWQQLTSSKATRESRRSFRTK